MNSVSSLEYVSIVLSESWGKRVAISQRINRDGHECVGRWHTETMMPSHCWRNSGPVIRAQRNGCDNGKITLRLMIRRITTQERLYYACIDKLISTKSRILHNLIVKSMRFDVLLSQMIQITSWPRPLAREGYSSSIVRRLDEVSCVDMRFSSKLPWECFPQLHLCNRAGHVGHVVQRSE